LGAGIPHVFDLFAQGRQALDRREGGLRLGLAIARSIVEAHGGAIEAKSGGRNHGATIAMRLPIARLSSAVSDKVSTTRDRPALATAAPRGRILLVDDNIDGAEMLADYLGALGYETSTAHDGPGALRAVDVVLPHAAVVDIGLPGMDGYELADELRRRLGDRAPALIALTGYAQASDRERALAAGFRAHFAKPVDLDKLAAAVEGIVRDVCRSGTSQE
jgi:CheY-like chemotaxis protein